MDHARTPPPRLSERSSVSLPPGLEDLLLSCLQKDPNDRPQSVAELAEAFETIPVSPVWTPSRARQWWLEHPVAGALDNEETIAAVPAMPIESRWVGPAS